MISNDSKHSVISVLISSTFLLSSEINSHSSFHIHGESSKTNLRSLNLQGITII